MEYKERYATAMALYNQPVGPDLPNQKFKRGSRIKVDDKMPSWMSHFDCGFEGIVEYTYAQKFGGNNIDSYSLIVLDKNNNPINTGAWYHEDQLTLIDDDIEPGLKIIGSYI